MGPPELLPDGRIRAYVTDVLDDGSQVLAVVVLAPEDAGFDLAAAELEALGVAVPR